MSDEVETMAYTGETPWHKHTNRVPEGLPPMEFLVRAGLDWEVEQQPLYLRDGTPIKTRHALVRSTDGRFISDVGKNYKAVQNRDAFKFFERFTDTGRVTMATAGSLKDGQHVWGLAKFNKSFTLPGKDDVDNYLLFHQPHVHGKALTIKLTPTRVVCWNTLTLALSDAANRAVFSMRHSQVFSDEIKDQAERALGLIEDQIINFAEAAKHLAAKSASPEQTKEYFGNVLHFDLSKVKKTKDGSEKLPVTLTRFHEALEMAPGHDLKSAKGTWWGNLNAVTFVLDHNNLARAWFGTGAAMKRKALDLALKTAA
jgi:phage/plasmid-like protein (TIGR03299 family)